MKKQLPSLIITTCLFIFSFSLFSQSLSVIPPTTTINGYANEELEFKVKVKNTGNRDISFKVLRSPISEVNGSKNAICVGTNCYMPDVSVTQEAIFIKIGETDSTFKAYYYGENNPGESVIQYCFFNEENIEDSTCIQVTYSALPVGVENIKGNGMYVSAFPNPASNVVNIKYDLNQENAGKFILINALGFEVFSTQLNNGQGQLSIPRGNLPSGIYFYTINTNTGNSGAMKLILR